MSFLFYLLESNLYLVILYGFYRALLHRETFHQLNRWYLLVALVLAFTAPLLKVNYRPAVAQELSQEDNTQVVAGGPEPVNPVSNKTHQQTNILPHFAPAIKADANTTQAVIMSPVRMLLAAYLIVTLFCLSSTFAALWRIIKLVRCSPRFSSGGVMYVLLEREGEAFSFFNWMFYYPADQPESAIITHELVHIRQKHSLDLLLFDLIRAVSWFNPLLYIIRSDIKLNHEYLADEQASRKCTDRHAYALLLINHSCGKVERAMTHQISSARQLKARILRLSKQPSAAKAKSKYGLALPVLAIIVCLSAFTVSKDYGLVNLTILDRKKSLGPVRLTQVPVLGIRHVSDPSFTTVKDNRKPVNLSAVHQLSMVKGQNIVPASVIQIEDTVPSRMVTASAADSLRNKSWAPQYIIDSVQKYEWAAKLISDSMQNDGRRAREILRLIQKESFDRSKRVQDSVQRAMAAMPVEDRRYHDVPKDVLDQATKEKLAYVDLLINRIESNYIELHRLIQASNAFRSQVRDSFPMAVGKQIAYLAYYISFNSIKIPAPDLRYKDAWVKNETERFAFFATSD